MVTNFFSDVAKSLKPLFVNSFTREVVRSFQDPDDYLELKLNEICSRCPFSQTRQGDNNSENDLSVINECRMEYFGQLLQSFVGRPGDEETIKLYSYLRKCEDCHTSKKKSVFELTTSHPVGKN